MAFWDQQYLANEVWRWLALFGVVLVSVVLGRVVSWILSGQSRRLKAAGRMPVVQVLLNSAVGPTRLLVLGGGLYFAGTVILTGTPHGVGMARKPDPRWLREGDSVTIEIEKIGALTNRVVLEGGQGA